MTHTRLVDLGGWPDSGMVRLSPWNRRWLRSNYLICRIDVGAFLAVILVLLFAFMSTQTVLHPRGAVDLAKVRDPKPMRGAMKEDALVIAVQRDGRVYLRTDVVTAESIPARIRDDISHGAENKVYIKADARAQYGSVKQVLDAVQASGVENIAFLTDQRHSDPSDR